MTDIFPSYSSRLVGVWKCISYELFAIDDNTSPSSSPTNNNATNTRTPLSTPHGPHPLGRLSISPHGWLAAHLFRPDRLSALTSGKPWPLAPDAEVAHVARGLAMYCGYMRLYEDGEVGGLVWRTQVEVASDPGRIGGVEERKVGFEREEDGGREVLVLEPVREMLMEDGTKTRAVLKWVKFE